MKSMENDTAILWFDHKIFNLITLPPPGGLPNLFRLIVSQTSYYTVSFNLCWAV